ncbi:MAG TPA: 3D domain-containing protein [Blastocatellia bacterium]|nr:3D domain-containing protein [Blastocatellia bacterium]
MSSTNFVPHALICASLFLLLGISISAQTQPHLVGDAWKVSSKPVSETTANPVKEASASQAEATTKDKPKTLSTSWNSTKPVEPNVQPMSPALELEAEVSIVKSSKLAALDSAAAEEIAGIEPPRSFQATAYSLRGRTRSGTSVRRGVIAADPRVLPLGSTVHLKAGNYTGVYLVQDTGKAIKGKRIDVWMPSSREARTFGRQNVRLTVLKYGGKRKPLAKAK